MATVPGLSDTIVLVFGTLVTLFAVLAAILFAFIYQRRLYKKQNEFRDIEKLLKKEELKSAYAMLDGEEKERKRIAEDLHDNLGSLLSTLRIYVDSLLDKVINTDVQATATRIGDLAEHAAEETRRISHNLDTGLLKHFGLKTSLVELCKAISLSEKIRAEALVDISQELSSELSVNIYRMIQELFSNTLKHARATEVRLEVTQIPGEYLNLIFEDNGKGFSKKDQKQKGVGLLHMESRVKRFNGELTIESGENIGTTVIIEIPLNDVSKPY